MSMCVRKPAGRFLSSRSTPIAPPITMANAHVPTTTSCACQSPACSNTASALDPQPHAREVALAHLQQALEARRERALRVLDHLAVDAHRALLELARGLGIAGGEPRGSE